MRRVPVVWVVLAVLLLAQCAVAVLVGAGHPVDETMPAILLTNTLYTLPGLMVLVRALRTPGPDRAAWLCLAAGMCSYAAGNVYWYVVVRPLDPEPLVTLADPGYLAFYPCFGAALVLLLRRRLPVLSAPVWLDGVIASGAITALVSVPLLATVEPTPGATTGDVIINAAYPVSDIVITGCLLGAWALCGWRFDRAMLTLIAGMALFTVGDAFGMVLLWQGVDPLPPWLDPLWVTSLAVLAAAAHQTGRNTVIQPRENGGFSTVVPSVLSFLCLGLLVWESITDTSVQQVSSVLAGTAVTAAIVRMMITVRSAEALGAARRQARTDDLTGLANRRAFVERLDGLLIDSASPRLAVAFVDLDRFKEVNDSFGHDVGDSLLLLVAARLRAALPDRFLLARLGGDEFGLILPGLDAEAAGKAVGGVLTTLREPFALPEVDLHVDASIGISVCPDDGADRPTLLRRADVAMYAAKTGHDGLTFATGLDDQARSRLTMLEELRAGLDRGELVLHYQPKVAVGRDRRVHGVEALVRWQHPDRGLVYPDAFLYTAESADLMGRITAVVLDLACRQIRTWHDEGLPIAVAVNLSVSNLRDPSFPDQVAALLHRYALPPAALELEVTESVLMTDADHALALLTSLRTMGLRLAVDDYGTGYSSLAYLQSLPVDDLKLDRAFVSRCVTDTRSAAIVASTVQLAHSLGMRIIAEGVEDDAILERLHEYGCDLAQGYGIARPQDAETTTRWLRSQTAVPSG
ncbi:EAL domain-containing protein [Actinoplanes sp. NPDC051851]|uniref:putative bifunctional diguanylate cyclase/phosphodiesterase n=1 Tax=Actinoplanes sp. NPDC051851 TaxID=3154753 RepID=UPI00343B12F9